MNIENKKTLKEVVLGILFVAGEGIEKSFIQEKLNITEKELEKAIQELQETYSGDNGIHIIKFLAKTRFNLHQTLLMQTISAKCSIQSEKNL